MKTGYIHSGAFMIWVCAVIPGELALLSSLIRKRLFLRYQLFSGFVLWLSLKSIILLLISSFGNRRTYFIVYLVGGLLAYGLQFGALHEICQLAFDPWRKVSTASSQVTALVAVLAASFCLFWSVSQPPSAGNISYDLLLTIDRGVTFASCIFFAVLVAIREILGIHWRHHIAIIAAGLGIMSGFELLTAITQTLSGPHWFNVLSIVRLVGNAAVLWMWAVGLAFPATIRSELNEQQVEQLVIALQGIETQVKRIRVTFNPKGRTVLWP